MHSAQLRKKFLEYFKNKGHVAVPSSSTVPHDDPSLLFANAGMNQFKDVFLGQAKRDYNRAVSAQKCIRVGGKHNDLENVGHTARHMTFFEMLGNFSFGDYFKKEAIAFAFEVTTELFALCEDRLWVSVFETDDEAYELWKMFIPESRIVRMGEEENFWSMGEVGPCGPCSELLFDRGVQYGSGQSPLEDPTGERYPEFWNLVFMQYNKDKAGQCARLTAQSVDTGAGLERVLMFGQNLHSVFETDVLRALIQDVERLCDKRYEPLGKTAPAFHVIADHLRALCFAIADGAQPSNLDRGYVLRKILRRAARYAKLLGLNEPFMAKLVPTLVAKMGEDYTELKSAQARITEILTLEEENFARTLQRGGNILNQVIEKSKGYISGDDAFKLKDTYGFPIEEILLLAKDHGLEVNLKTYETLEQKARARSQKAQKKAQQAVEQSVYSALLESKFVGDTLLEAEGSIVGIISNGTLVEKLEAKDEAIVILDQTPFYAEKGGQIGDQGQLAHQDALFLVTETIEPYPGIIAHVGQLKKGVLILGEPLTASVERGRRKKITCNHTATHLLQWALIKVLGPHIQQAGSLVEPYRLRFDFNHHKALTDEQLRAIEQLINEKIKENAHVHIYTMPLEDVDKDVKQFFGDKYGSIVRVVDVGGFSKELCGGTHVRALHEIGLFRICKESSIAAGVRRIEACTGVDAELLMYRREDQIKQIAEHLQTSPSKLTEKVQMLLAENISLKAEIKVYKAKSHATASNELLAKSETINGVFVIASVVDVSFADLQTLSNDLLGRLGSGIVCLGARSQEKAHLVIRVSDDMVAKGYLASDLIKKLAPIIGGGGGGKQNSAAAGGTLPEKLSDAFDALRNYLKN